MAREIKNIVVTGAAGHIGYALLFRIASGQMFGSDTEINLHLLDLTLPALNGVQMELEDCAFPLLKNIVCTDQFEIAMRDVNWAILVGAKPRGKGMERSDLLKENAPIFKAQGEALNKFAAPDVRVLVVGNPCNTNCLIAMHHAPDIPRDRFYAMTMLDEKRSIVQLATKARVSTEAITRMTIWGNHSSTQYPDFYNARINGVPANQVINDEAWLQETFIQTVQQRGAKVIEAREASSAGSAANAIISSVYHLTHDTELDNTFSVSKCSEGEYDVDEGLIFSYPCRTERGIVKVVPGFEHNAFAREKLKMTLAEVRHEKEIIQAAGLT